MIHSEVSCKKCGEKIRSFSPMRKWCVDCRRLISLEQAKVRKGRVLVVEE